MKLLVYGAGVIGSIFAGKIALRGFDVTILARNNRYREIKENGLILTNPLTNKTDRVNVKLIDTLTETDYFDFIIITVQFTQIEEILPVLQKNKSPNLVFVVNNPLGYQKWIDAVGYERIMTGFPSAGGERKDGVVYYYIGKGIAKLFQATTFGELNGQRTQRLKDLFDIFKKSGFSPSINDNMAWWQKTHVAVILPAAKALYRYQANNYELSKSYKTLKNMVLATREMFEILKNAGVQITPFKLHFYYLPAFLVAKLWQIVMNTQIAEYAMSKHAAVGTEEMEALERQFMSLNTKGIRLDNYGKL